MYKKILPLLFTASLILAACMPSEAKEINEASNEKENFVPKYSQEVLAYCEERGITPDMIKVVPGHISFSNYIVPYGYEYWPVVEVGIAQSVILADLQDAVLRKECSSFDAIKYLVDNSFLTYDTEKGLWMSSILTFEEIGALGDLMALAYLENEEQYIELMSGVGVIDIPDYALLDLEKEGITCDLLKAGERLSREGFINGQEKGYNHFSNIMNKRVDGCK